MDRRLLRLALSTLLLGTALPAAVQGALAQGTPRSIGECERLKNDLAYNQCLAMFGPAAKNIAGGDGAGGGPPPQDYAPDAAAAAGIPSPEEPELAEPGSRSRRGRGGRRGRQSMSFAIATAGDDVATDGSSAHRSSRRHRRRH